MYVLAHFYAWFMQIQLFLFCTHYHALGYCKNKEKVDIGPRIYEYYTS